MLCWGNSAKNGHKWAIIVTEGAKVKMDHEQTTGGQHVQEFDEHGDREEWGQQISGRAVVLESGADQQ